MPIVMTMWWPGFTEENYEAVRKATNFEKDWPKGGMFHVASFGDGAMNVTDIWETAEDFQNFVDQKLTPATTALGITSEPKVLIQPMHNVFNTSVNTL